MKRRIFAAVLLCAVLAALCAAVCAAWVAWRQSTDALRSEVRSEATFLSAGVNTGGMDYLRSIQGAARVTLIEPDGTVIFDSAADAPALDNHLDRPEVRAALTYGSGEAVRESATLTRNTFYCAVRLESGQVLRLSAFIPSVWATLPALLPFLALLLLMTVAVALFIGHWATRRVVAPINAIDLAHPQCPYDELAPLIRRLEDQNREIEVQMSELERRHRENDAMRREFTANVSHELKTPLQTISGSAEIIQSGLVPPEDQPRFIANIYRESQRLMTLVEDILRLSRLDEGVALNKEPVELLALAQETVARLTPAAQAGWLTLKAVGEPRTVVTDRRVLEEILFNLTDNAIKYNKPGGSVTLSITPEGFSVTDTGVGIPPEHQERVFERFYRVDASRSKTIGGTGLGLSIVKHGAAAIGAQIKLESAPDAGTTVTVLLP